MQGFGGIDLPLSLGARTDVAGAVSVVPGHPVSSLRHLSLLPSVQPPGNKRSIVVIFLLLLAVKFSLSNILFKC